MSKNKIAAWKVWDIWGEDNIIYLKGYKNNRYRLMIDREGMRDVKVLPEGPGDYFIIPPEKLAESINAITNQIAGECELIENNL